MSELEHHHHHNHHHHDTPGGAGHAHPPKDFSRAFAIGVALNLALVLGQIGFGLLAHSLALVADAGHNFADVIGLLLAWWASKLLKSTPTKKHTYGLRGASILAALANAILLLVTMGAVAWEAIMRFEHPLQVDGKIVIWVSAAGIGINGLSALLFFSGRRGDLNIRGAFLHLAADAVIAFGVVLAGIAILLTGKLWIDPAVGLVIVAVIVYGTWGLLRESLNLALQAVPAGIDIGLVHEYLEHLPRVVEVHDLHIWAMSTTEVALTAHLVVTSAAVDDALLAEIAHELQARFKIGHSTLQIETGDPTHPCQLAPAETV